jgi:methylenetetrahydrofolate dehydrogenase (NADP+)/methenyltetrahydrofolate cyclohydrolase
LSTASIALRREGDARALLPATPLGILRLMEQMGVSVACTKVAVVGKGLVVGAPLREMLVVAGAEVVGIEKGTVAPEALSKACDVVVTATGVADLITEAWVKPGAVVIDAGTTELTSGQTLQGDVSRARVEGTAGILTPVPGGVGPVTVASLLTNIADAACLQLGRPRVRWVIDGASGA